MALSLPGCRRCHRAPTLICVQCDEASAGELCTVNLRFALHILTKPCRKVLRVAAGLKLRYLSTTRSFLLAKSYQHASI